MRLNLHGVLSIKKRLVVLGALGDPIGDQLDLVGGELGAAFGHFPLRDKLSE